MRGRKKDNIRRTGEQGILTRGEFFYIKGIGGANARPEVGMSPTQEPHVRSFFHDQALSASGAAAQGHDLSRDPAPVSAGLLRLGRTHVLYSQ